MAILELVDGQKQRVAYDKAAKLKLYLIGEKETTDPKLIAVLCNIKNILFDDELMANAPKHDSELQKIINDKTLKGYDKFKAVGNYMRNKRVAI